MRTAVAVTLIVAGTFLVALPTAADHLHTRNLIRMMSGEVRSVNLEGRMSELYRFGCWVLGAAMIAGAVALTITFGPPRGSQLPDRPLP